MRFAVALSGGVDSSVSAALLKSQGHEVVGITLQQWPRGADSDGYFGGCCSLHAVEDARRVADVIGIPYFCWNLEREFGDRVIQPFHSAYQAGRTPNPCVRCNAFVRFDLMLNRVTELGFDRLATGHYARIVDGPRGPELHQGVDPAKDQSYVLYHLDRQKLERLMFPLGELTKAQVRDLARDFGLPVAEKPESQEICFVPLGQTDRYLRDHVRMTPGSVVDLSGEQLGTHMGAQRYTVGQREGLGNLALPGPWYVARVDADTNTVVVGRREDLLRSQVVLEELTFVDGQPPRGELEARLRYRARPLRATLDGSTLHLLEPAHSAAPGQSAVLYRGSRVLGGGVITYAA